MSTDRDGLPAHGQSPSQILTRTDVEQHITSKPHHHCTKLRTNSY